MKNRKESSRAIEWIPLGKTKKEPGNKLVLVGRLGKVVLGYCLLSFPGGKWRAFKGTDIRIGGEFDSSTEAARAAEHHWEVTNGVKAVGGVRPGKEEDVRLL